MLVNEAALIPSHRVISLLFAYPTANHKDFLFESYVRQMTFIILNHSMFADLAIIQASKVH